MDLGGLPDGNDISGDNSVNRNEVHHDPLNEHLEETWSAVGEQDVPSATGSDPGLLPPPIPTLPTTLGSIIGQPIEHQGMSELSVLHAPNPTPTISAASIDQGGSEESITDMPGKRDLKITPTAGVQIPKIAQAGFRIFAKKGSVQEVEEAGSDTIQKRKPSKTSQNEPETPKRQSSKKGIPSTPKEEALQLDMFFQTMYNTTQKLSLVKQIELRREIRQLVMNAEKQEQIANRKKSATESTTESSQSSSDSKKRRTFSSSK